MCSCIPGSKAPEWFIDQWNSGHSGDIRKCYRFKKITNYVCLLVVIVVVAMFGPPIMKILTSGYSYKSDEVSMWILIGLSVFLSVGPIMMFRQLCRAITGEPIKLFEDALTRLTCLPRPQLTPGYFSDREALVRAVRSAMVDLAARKIVFVEYEKVDRESSRALVSWAQADLGALLNVSKEARLVPFDETFHGAFAEAEKHRVPWVRREFNDMLKDLPKGERPDIFW
jgi:hypothetical protein